MIALLAAAAVSRSDLSLPNIFSNNMVLQRNADVPFFGKATPGARVKVEMHGHFALTTAKPDGSWIVRLRPMPAGGPFEVDISSDGAIKTYSNVMVGEVWVASGQSNMEFTQAGANDMSLAATECDPAVRMFTVTKVSTETPADDVEGSWVVSSPDTIPQFSAVGNAFANALHKELGVPIGIIHTSWGGTPAESWTSRPGLLAHPHLAAMVRNYLATIKDYPEKKAAYDKAYAEWLSKVQRPDPGNAGFGEGWALPNAPLSGWHATTLPNLIEVTEAQDMDGAVWYRRTFDLPDDWYGKSLTLRLGTIDDFDDTYINGHRVGTTDASNQFAYAVNRVYRVAPGVLLRGQNTIAVRVFDRGGRGGFTGAGMQMTISPEDGTGTPIPLAGDWMSRIEVRYDPPTQQVQDSQPQAPFGPGNPWAPGGLYNGMIAPLIPYAIRGAIWYQGESNADRAYQYRELFPAMIQDWRSAWGEGDFPFYFVQLANFTARLPEPAESDWAELREAQTMTLSLPNTGMATIIDIGEANDIHPKNKREVGRRLALNALAKVYGRPNEFSGPMFESMSREGTKIRLKFTHASDLKTSSGEPVIGFAIAGADHKFVWAQAKIEGETVVVWSDAVTDPVAVRYGWANNPEVDLVNGAGLPAVPFRTDSWPGITAGKG